MRKPLIASFVLAACATASLAKLPAPPQDDAAKAKAAETAAKAGWQAKIDAWQLCKSQDKVAAAYRKSHPEAAKPVATAAVKPAAAASASAPAGTPVASVPPTPCADPGPFAYNAPSQTPLESSGAHSPAGNAASPPSVRPEAAQMAPNRK